MKTNNYFFVKTVLAVVVLFISGSTITGQTLKAKWTFENSEVRGEDTSGNGVVLNTGSSTNINFSNDQAGSFLNFTLPEAGNTQPPTFTDTNYRCDFASPDIAGQVTLSAWFKATTAGTVVNSSSTIGYIFSTPGYNLFTIKAATETNTYEKIRFQTRRAAAGNQNAAGTAGSFETPAITLNQWHHVVVVYDPSSIDNYPTIYVDGVSVSVLRSAAPVGDQMLNGGLNGSTAFVGNTLAGTRGFNGSFDNLRIYDGALDVTAVQLLYTSEQRSGTTIVRKTNETDIKIFVSNSFIYSDLTALKGNVQLSVLDTKGSLLKTLNSHGGQIVSVPFTDKGVYLVRIQSETGLALKKIVLN